jgi:hypothetical protein
MAIAVIMTWVFNRTQGSLLLAMLTHASVNTTQVAVVNRLFPSMASSEVDALLAFGVTALALIVATRGRLGYQGAGAGAPTGLVAKKSTPHDGDPAIAGRSSP